MITKQEQYEIHSVVTATDVKERFTTGSEQYREIILKCFEPLLDIILDTKLISTGSFILSMDVKRNVGNDVLKINNFKLETKMVDNHNVSALLLVSVEQALRGDLSEEDHATVLAEVQELLRGVQDATEEEPSTPEVEAEDTDAMAEGEYVPV